MVEAGKQNNKKLVENTPDTSFEVAINRDEFAELTNRKLRRMAEPHLRPHKVKGRVYYTYVRGTDKEIYLGDANAILRAVRAFKE